MYNETEVMDQIHGNNPYIFKKDEAVIGKIPFTPQEYKRYTPPVRKVKEQPQVKEPKKPIYEIEREAINATPSHLFDDEFDAEFPDATVEEISEPVFEADEFDTVTEPSTQPEDEEETDEE